jgi:peptidoglycan/LPS O-acetylase OafA/YrhL
MHLHALTGLRVFAALAVYMSHLRVPESAPDWLRSLCQNGSAGVTFFFILSGFVLTLNYHDRLRTRRQLWNYAVARFARIYPVYLVVLTWPVVHLWAQNALAKWQLLEHLLLLQAWDPDVHVAMGFVGPAWSISVELFLYATLPLLVPLVRLLDRRTWTLVTWIALVLVAVAAVAFLFESVGHGALPMTDPASSHRWLYRTPLFRLGDFLVGILAARLYMRLRNGRAAQRLGSWLIPSSLAGTVLVAAQPALVSSTWTMDAAFAPLAAALILGLALAPRHPASRLMALPLVVFLGEASFAFYLVHQSVIVLVGAGAWTGGVSSRTVALEAVNLGLAVVVAIGLYVGVERPARTTVMRLLCPPSGARKPDAAHWAPPRPRPVAAHANTRATPRPAPAHALRDGSEAGRETVRIS